MWIDTGSFLDAKVVQSRLIFANNIQCRVDLVHFLVFAEILLSKCIRLLSLDVL